VLTLEPGLLSHALANQLGHRRRESENVAGDDDGTLAGLVFEHQRLRPEVVLDFLERLVARRVARGEHRHLGRNLHGREADLPFGGSLRMSDPAVGRDDDGECNERSDELAHARTSVREW
jgi:hypothetical protein